MGRWKAKQREFCPNEFIHFLKNVIVEKGSVVGAKKQVQVTGTGDCDR